MLRYQVSLDLIRKRSQKKTSYTRTVKKLYKVGFALIITSSMLIILNSQIFDSRSQNSKSNQPLSRMRNLFAPNPNGNDNFLDFKDLIDNFSASEESNTECRITRLDPYNLSVLPNIREDVEINCESKFPLIFTSSESSHLVQVVKPSKYGLDNCCYRKLVRYKGSDNSVGLSNKCIPIVQQFTKLSPDHEFISIRCQNKRTGKMGAVDMLGFVPLKADVKLRISIQNKKLNTMKRKIARQSTNQNGKVNVVILGLDSISHMNFIRIMPKTHTFLKHNLSAVGMNGYTKIGDNTFPNAVAFLTGMNESQLVKSCWPTKRSFFDNCPFLWKEYEAQGFATSFAEDGPSMAIFNYQKSGFNNSPVDYYLRPLTFLQDKLIGNHMTINANVCYGPRTGFEVLLQHLQKMAFTMKTHRTNYFQFIWATSLFHDYLNLGKNGDEILLQSLQQFQNAGYFANTVFLLMSDHGMRWGPIRQTAQGKIEERMPFLYFILPQWFKEQFPKAVENLKVNANRLTTPFDLHETLKNLLHLQQIENSNLDLKASRGSTNTKDIPKGISLFFPISVSRNCDDASIPSHFCVCSHNMRPIPIDNPKVLDAATFIISKINDMLTEFHECAVLKLNQVLASGIGIRTRRSQLGNGGKSLMLNLEFITTPGNATFEASLESSGNSRWSVQDITRTNLYGQQSSCVSDYDIKKFCYCY